MSTHSIDIIEITEIKEHPNADLLEVIPVGKWQCVSQKGTWTIGDKAVYVEPDYVVPTRHECFSFLSDKEMYRLKAVKLRGELSFGLLVPVPQELAHLPVGANVMDLMGIERYVPPEKYTSADALPQSQWPKLYTPKFDVESYNKYPDLIDPSEIVVATEKIHGANARFVFNDDTMFCGSRNLWVVNNGTNQWATVRKNIPAIEEFCRAHPNHILYGEVFGPVQSLKYGRKNVDFAAFAIQKSDGNFVDYAHFSEICSTYGVQCAPCVYHGPLEGFDFAIAEQDSKVSLTPQMMEGVVITPEISRTEQSIGGPVILKHISNRYWLKK